MALTQSKATVILSRRKNSAVPVTLKRECCCESTGEKLCGVHWLHKLAEGTQGEDGRVFQIGKSKFANMLRKYGEQLTDLPAGSRLSSHAFRRGMAQDIIDHGGSLSVLLRAGDWCSSAYLQYLRHHQHEDAAASQAIIMLSDSDREF